MRSLRILGLALVGLGLVVAVLAAVVLANQDRILKTVLDRVSMRTGFQIVPAGGHVALSSHLIVVLDRPRVFSGNRQVARAARAEAKLSYRSLVYSSGLPLFALILDHPEIRVASPRSSIGMVPIPRFDAANSRAIVGGLHLLSSVTRRVEISEGSLVDNRGASLVSHLDFTGYSRRHLIGSPWWIRFSLSWDGEPGAGARVAGDLRLGYLHNDIVPVVVQGVLWAWDVHLDHLDLPGNTATGVMQTEITLAFHDDGHADGAISLDVRDLVLQARGKAPLGNCSLHAKLAASNHQFGFTGLKVQRGASLIAIGQGRLDEPFGSDPKVTASLEGIKADAASLKWLIKSGAVVLPQSLEAAADRTNSGQVSLDQVNLETTLARLKSLNTSLIRDFSIDGRLEHASFTMAPEIKLPQVDEMNAKVNFARGMLTVSQGGLRAGKSSLSGFELRADLTHDTSNAPYEVRLAGNADLGETYSWLSDKARRSGADPASLPTSASGAVGFELHASGMLDGLRYRPPSDYGGRVTPIGVEVVFKTPPANIVVEGGEFTFTSDQVTLNRLRLALHPGEVLLNGAIETRKGGIVSHGLEIVLQRVPAARWLPQAVPADQIAADGDVDGKVVIALDTAEPSKYQLNGGVTMGKGQIHFGFLRAPMYMPSATLIFKGHDAVLDMPSSTLEGQLVSMKVTITNLQDPAMHIDAVAQKLDLEAVTMIRLPWTPKTPTHLLGGRTTGHIEVRSGNLSKLPLSNLSTDFERNGGDWRVYNLHATSLDGRVDLDLLGRAKDDWIRMRGKVSAMDNGRLLSLTGTRNPPVVGKLYAEFDLWANTNTDFFKTLAGTAAFVVKDGRLQRFTLLSRVLGLIDLKNWLSAQVQDPRQTGLPFKYFSASFAGHDGWFLTDDLLLDGPVVDIVGQGSLDFGDNSIAMELGVLPFQTVSWLLGKIPLLGKGLSETSGALLAAYFWVHGPIQDPDVTPLPILSAAEIIKKTLGLPINLLRPNTIK